MEMFDVAQLEYDKRDGDLSKEAQGVVKSTKYFPLFYRDAVLQVMKPLSKTKPMCTVMYAYSEVYWSYIIKKFFMPDTPQYKLATCRGIEKEQAKYYEKGTLVPYVLKENQTMQNMVEYYADKEAAPFNLNYTNYCGRLYDYAPFFDCEPFISNPQLGEQLAFQVLLSYLKQDQNFHYENVSFIKEGEQLVTLAPPLDHEFSTMFLYPDDKRKLKLDTIMGGFMPFNAEFQDEKENLVNHTLRIIYNHYPDMFNAFAENIEEMVTSLSTSPVMLKDNGFMEPFHSNQWRIGYAKFKELGEAKAKRLESSIQKRELDLPTFSTNLNEEVINSGKLLHNAMRNVMQKQRIYTI